MGFMRITMRFGQIEMRLRTMNKDMMLLWLKKKLCQMLKKAIKNKQTKQ